MKTGIFGGTFNPVHMGHILNSLFVKERFGLERVLLVPARVPVHKSSPDLAGPDHRLEMLSLAAAPFQGLHVSSIEIDRDEPSYTVLTLRELAAGGSAPEPALIMGSDSFNELDTWREYREILVLCDIIIIGRPGASMLRGDLLSMSERIHIAGNPDYNISSTEIRRRLKGGLSVEEMIPPAVAEYIYKKGLYVN